jgi:hypothetical protein
MSTQEALVLGLLTILVIGELSIMQEIRKIRHLLERKDR